MPPLFWGFESPYVDLRSIVTRNCSETANNVREVLFLPENHFQDIPLRIRPGFAIRRVSGLLNMLNSDWTGFLTRGFYGVNSALRTSLKNRESNCRPYHYTRFDLPLRICWPLVANQII